MSNPFEPINARLTNLEALTLEVLQLIRSTHPLQPDTAAEPYGSFLWLKTTCSGIPASTLRQKSAAGEIPGTKKIGKRVLYEKATILNWLKGQEYTPRPKADGLKASAEAQFTAQHQRKGGRKDA